MTIEEKLQHFYEVSLDEAREDAAQAIQEHKEHLARTLEDHKQTSRQNAEAEIKAETGHVRREVNKALSAEQITLRRDLSRKQEELKETLFAEVKTKVQQFITTAEYDEYLCRRINEAVKFAGDDEIQIYLSKEDEPRLKSLTVKTGFPLKLSDESFIGGIRAIIPEKNILIDNSFEEGYQAAYREFKFDGGPAHE